MVHIGMQDTHRVVAWCHIQGLFDPSTADPMQVLCTLRQCPELFEWYEPCGALKHFTATQIIGSAFSAGNFNLAPLLLGMLARPSSFREDATFTSLQCLAMIPDQEDQLERLLQDPKFVHLADKVVYAAVRPGGSKVLPWNVSLMRVTRVDYVPMAQMVQRFAQQFAHIDTTEWLATSCEIKSFTPPVWPMQSDAEQMQVCSWLHTTGRGNWTLLPLGRAVELGSLSLIKWFHTHRPSDFTSRTMDVAATEGHLDILQWLHYNRSEGCTQQAMDGAAFAGHLPVVQWLHTHRTECHTNFAMARAVLGGRLDVASWLYENRSDACASCVVNFALSYAHIMPNDTPLIHTLRWLDARGNRRQGCDGTCCELPRSRLTRSVADMALNVGDVALLAYLYEHHPECVASWPRMRDRVARLLVEQGRLGSVQWMFTHHCDDCDWQAVRTRAEGQKFVAIVAWLDKMMVCLVEGSNASVRRSCRVSREKKAIKRYIRQS